MFLQRWKVWRNTADNAIRIAQEYRVLERTRPLTSLETRSLGCALKLARFAQAECADANTKHWQWKAKYEKDYYKTNKDG